MNRMLLKPSENYQEVDVLILKASSSSLWWSIRLVCSMIASSLCLWWSLWFGCCMAGLVKVDSCDDPMGSIGMKSEDNFFYYYSLLSYIPSVWIIFAALLQGPQIIYMIQLRRKRLLFLIGLRKLKMSNHYFLWLSCICWISFIVSSISFCFL